MNQIASMAVLLASLMAGAVTTEAQQAPDPRVADLVKAGRLRVGFGLGSPVLAMKNPTNGEVRGPAADLARALALKIGVQLQPVEYPRPGAVLAGLRNSEWDVTFLGVDPARTSEVDFSLPYMQSDFTYLVPGGSSKRSVNDMDQQGIRIAVPRGDASDLLLTRLLKKAELVRADTLAAAIEMLRAGQADAYAAPRPVLLALGRQLPGSRVLDDGFAAMGWAAAVPKDQAGRLAYVNEFLKEAMTSGLVKQTIERARLQGVQAVSPGKAD